jgi:NAD(P)-dependent dehydrogenase (short-subunit alcohol dehydrogenase family)
MGLDEYSYEGRRVLVVGGASGMGAAAAALAQDLGGEVIVADIAVVSMSGTKVIKLDLREPDSIDKALDAVGGAVDAVFSCAGVANESIAMKVNFLGQRYLLEKMVDRSLLASGAAIGVVSSTAGYGWERHLAELEGLLATKTFDEGVAWSEQHTPLSTYVLSKRAMSAYAAWQALPFLKQGIRINAIMPGPTDTPLAQANASTWLAAGTEYREAVSIEICRPEDQASVLAFLCSPAAVGITGTNVIVDYGLMSARLLHGFPPKLHQ